MSMIQLYRSNFSIIKEQQSSLTEHGYRQFGLVPSLADRVQHLDSSRLPHLQNSCLVRAICSLRARPFDCSFSAQPYDTPQNEADHTEDNEGGVRTRKVLEVLGHPSAAAEPAERALNDPAFWAAPQSLWPCRIA